MFYVKTGVSDMADYNKPTPLNLKTGNFKENCRKFKCYFHTYLLALDLEDGKSYMKKIALLLNIARPPTTNLFYIS